MSDLLKVALVAYGFGLLTGLLVGAALVILFGVR